MLSYGLKLHFQKTMQKGELPSDVKLKDGEYEN